MDDLEKYRGLDDEGNVYVSPNEMVVRYRPLAELERWVRYRLSEKSEKKNRYIWIMVGLFFILGGPVAVATLAQMLVSLLAVGGNAGAAAAAAASSSFAIVTWFYAMVAFTFAAAAITYISKPTHLSLTDQGLQLIWFHRFRGIQLLKLRSKLITWDKISRVIIDKPAGKPSPNDHQLTFMSGSNTEMKLRLGAFWTTDDRTRVLEAVDRWAPSMARDAEVVSALEPPADYSYTELWMKALSAPPKRERLKPLAENSFLREGKYRVAGALGVGGQGTAYLAYDIGAENRTVVLKEFILPVYVDIAVRKQALDKFEREAKILKQLDHPQVVKLIDFFVEDHRGYLVLEHIDG